VFAGQARLGEKERREGEQFAEGQRHGRRHGRLGGEYRQVPILGSCPAGRTRQAAGRGLVGMTERARALGGTMCAVKLRKRRRSQVKPNLITTRPLCGEIPPVEPPNVIRSVPTGSPNDGGSQSRRIEMTSASYAHGRSTGKLTAVVILAIIAVLAIIAAIIYFTEPAKSLPSVLGTITSPASRAAAHRSTRGIISLVIGVVFLAAAGLTSRLGRSSAQ
jgi:hypothetical protein